jgi:2-amino-4-hydroxy-6-hydroxymethyldihydropteridine diphosphokinase
MKNDKPGPKSGPKRTTKPDSKRENRPEGAKPGSKTTKSGAFSPKVTVAKSGDARKGGDTRKTSADGKPERGATQAFPPKKYINVYLGLGSNMGNRATNLRNAAGLIDKLIGKIARKSRIYDTEPWGKTDQDHFYNQVLMVNTTLDPRDLLEAITTIEKEMGRVKTEKWGPRIIDIDILLYGKRVVRDKGLDIPHPEMHQRMFVLVPLMEIAPELEHPILKQPIDALYIECTDPTEVVDLEIS